MHSSSCTESSRLKKMLYFHKNTALQSSLKMYYCCLNITSWCCVVYTPCSAPFAAIKHTYKFSTVENNPLRNCQTHYIDPVRKKTMY